MKTVVIQEAIEKEKIEELQCHLAEKLRSDFFQAAKEFFKKSDLNLQLPMFSGQIPGCI